MQLVGQKRLQLYTKEDAIERLSRGKHLTDKDKKDITERYDYLMSLKPKKLIYGASGLQRYFGALITDNLVIFENIEYGNAIYVMYDNWEGNWGQASTIDK